MPTHYDKAALRITLREPLPEPDKNPPLVSG